MAERLKAEMWPIIPLLLDFHQRPDQKAIKSARVLVRTSTQEIKPGRRVGEIYKYLNSLKEVNWSNIEADPVFMANMALSPSLLLSYLSLETMREWAAFVLLRTGRLTGKIKKEIASVASPIIELTEKPKDQWDKTDSIINRIAQTQRNHFIFLSAEELSYAQGFDLEREFLSPLKLAEMKIGYDSHITSLESRAASTLIPFDLRAFVGNLRFGRQIQAQGSAITVLRQELEHVFLSHSYWMNLVKEEAERFLGIKLELTGEEFSLKKGKLDQANLSVLTASSQLIKVLHQITTHDYGEIRLLNIRNISDLKELREMAHDLAVAMVDPAVNEPLVIFKTIEAAATKNVVIPEKTLGHYHQIHTVLRNERQAFLKENRSS